MVNAALNLPFSPVQHSTPAGFAEQMTCGEPSQRKGKSLTGDALGQQSCNLRANPERDEPGDSRCGAAHRFGSKRLTDATHQLTDGSRLGFPAHRLIATVRPISRGEG
jgi:hypothetical protein